MRLSHSVWGTAFLAFLVILLAGCGSTSASNANSVTTAHITPTVNPCCIAVTYHPQIMATFSAPDSLVIAEANFPPNVITRVVLLNLPGTDDNHILKPLALGLLFDASGSLSYTYSCVPSSNIPHYILGLVGMEPTTGYSAMQSIPLSAFCGDNALPDNFQLHN